MVGVTMTSPESPETVPGSARAPAARNPRRQATAVLGAGSARVLEPSPPANHDEPYFADDPVDPNGGSGVEIPGPVVVPSGMAAVPSGDGVTVIDWDQWLTDHPERGDWVAQRWLGGRRRLPDAPPSLAETRTALHRLAAYVIAPVRHRANGKFGLRWTKGGFGTPFFGDNRQIRVEGVNLVDQQGNDVRYQPIGSLQEAAGFLHTVIDPDTAAEHDSPPVGGPAAPLAVHPDSVAFLDGWFGMAFAALELLRSDRTSTDPSRPQLWPGHFDPAIEVGTDDSRASYGASPGDDGSDEPYLYVSVWWPERVGVDADDPFWNGQGFVGRIMKLSDVPADADPVRVAAAFWGEARDRLHGNR
jgi:hypothetical protein